MSSLISYHCLSAAQSFSQCRPIPFPKNSSMVSSKPHNESTEEDTGTGNTRRATAPAGVFQARDNVIGHLNPSGDGNSDDGFDGNKGNNNNNNTNSNGSLGGVAEGPEVDGGERSNGVGDTSQGGGDGEGCGGEEAGADEENKEGIEEKEKGKDDEEEEDGEPPFEKGSFFFKVDDKDKGHYKVRDVSCFLLTSMYKRKDRVTRTAGVSLLVGKLEDPPHEEKVISALFDTDRFTERAAAQWWEDNGHRFEDARSLAAKKVRHWLSLFATGPSFVSTRNSIFDPSASPNLRSRPSSRVFCFVSGGRTNHPCR